ncbi:MAG: DUF1992 domain-containing protein [Desulfobacterales bacterium]|nr:DUF1992 domain-containing protein [Desulfobacterales bacterium]
MASMLTGFEKIVEERIQQSIRKGDFEGLQGAGKPLELEDFSNVPEDLRMAYKILKNADCVPPEIETRKEILQTEALLENMTDERERLKTIKKLNFLIMKLNSARAGSIQLEIPQKYESKLVERMDATHMRAKI